MPPDSATGTVTALDTLLDKERAALLAGDLDQVSAMLDEKTRLVDTLNALDPNERPALDDLKTKLMRNQMVLDGALQGIRKVTSRLAALTRMRHSFDTYDESGCRQTIDGDIVRRVERRA